MTAHNPQVPWTDEQWARANQVIQEEASRARVAARFLPLVGPLHGSTDFVRAETIFYRDNHTPPPDQQIGIKDRKTIQLATLQVKVAVRSAQMADQEMRSVLALFRRAANVLARLEDAVVFRGLVQVNPHDPLPVKPRGGAPTPIWEIHGGEVSDGLYWAANSGLEEVYPRVDQNLVPYPGNLQDLVAAASGAIGKLEKSGHFGPFALVLDQEYYKQVQTPDPGSLVLPQDRIIPFLGGGPLLRSSTLCPETGVMVALGGEPVELVVAADMSVQFLQVTQDPNFLFRIRERIALRIKEGDAIINIKAPCSPPHSPPRSWDQTDINGD